MARLVKTGVATRFDIRVFDSNDDGKTGLLDASFTKLLTKDGADSAVTVTVTEVSSGSGRYTVTFTPNATGYWSLFVAHSTHDKRGWSEDFDVTTDGIESLTDIAGAILVTAANKLTTNASGQVTVGTIVASELNSVADALLKRDVDNVEATAAIHSLASIILKLVSRFKSTTGQTYRTNGTTVHMTQTPVTDSAATPITELGVAS